MTSTDGTTGRIRISVPKLDMGEAAATTLALVVHELATNSLKYGVAVGGVRHARLWPAPRSGRVRGGAGLD